MRIGSFFKSFGHLSAASTLAAAAPVLTAAEKVVSELLPEFGDEIAAFSKTLPNDFNSLLVTATAAKEIVAKAKDFHLSTSLAVHLAQAVITAHWPEIVTEAEGLLAAKPASQAA